MRKSVRVKGVALLILLAFTAAAWYAVVREDRGSRLTVSVLSVGADDAIFIDAPSGRQVLFDGGSNGSVLRALGSVMPPWDRSIDVVIAASTDQHSSAGLIDVLQRYRVATIVQTGVENSAPTWNLFEQEASQSGARIVSARRGQVIDLGKGVYLQILFPDRSAPQVASADGCVIARLVYGNTSFIIMCNASIGVQNYVAMLDGKKLKSDVLIMKGNPSPIFAGYVSASFVASSTAMFFSDGQRGERE